SHTKHTGIELASLGFPKPLGAAAEKYRIFPSIIARNREAPLIETLNPVYLVGGANFKRIPAFSDRDMGNCVVQSAGVGVRIVKRFREIVWGLLSLGISERDKSGVSPAVREKLHIINRSSLFRGQPVTNRGLHRARDGNVCKERPILGDN